jgi:hypothetical protein
MEPAATIAEKDRRIEAESNEVVEVLGTAVVEAVVVAVAVVEAVVLVTGVDPLIMVEDCPLMVQEVLAKVSPLP